MPDKTWLAGEVVTAADTNTYLTHTGGAWTSYTPTFTNLTVGNGTLVSMWFRSGRFVAFKVKLTFGSTTSVSGAVTASLPVAYADGTELNLATGLLFDSSLPVRVVALLSPATTTTVNVTAFDVTGTYGNGSALSSLVPFTWATGDIMLFSGFYEAAS